ncbi:MED14-domain-containing protein [Mucidula mucida]|nr:MED14-domain-containing protein [Mucidula mucida]
MAADTNPIENGNGPHMNGNSEFTLDQLERELPFVANDQVYLGDLLGRVMQTIYAELSELAETMPNMSDSARKRTLADWVVKTKKQIVKLYAVAKWSRDAATVQKCMNVTAFLMNQNRQFADAVGGINFAREGLDPARLRNHDLLTSLDVLTTGSYRRLPTVIKKTLIPLTPLTDAQVLKTLGDLEDAMRYRLRLSEIIPIEMSEYKIANGRVVFTVPKLFQVTLCASGSEKTDGWFFVHAEFLITAGATGIQEFPRIPTGVMKRYITEEADSRLGYYVPIPEEPLPPGVERPPGYAPPTKPTLPEGFVDAPLVRVFNFLQMMSLSYQLEILLYQAERMRSLGWAEYMRVQMTADRKQLTVSYWVRKPSAAASNRPQQQQRQSRIPLLAGTVTIAIVQAQSNGKPDRTPRNRILSEIQYKAKLANLRPSDEVEGLRFKVTWEPESNALGVHIPQDALVMPQEILAVNPDDLDFQSLLTNIITRHTRGILTKMQENLRYGPSRNVFGGPGIVSLVDEASSCALRIRLCAEEIVIITLDPRTGHLNVRDTGDLASAGRGPRFAALTAQLLEHPDWLVDYLMRLRISTLIDLAEQTAQYLGLQCYRTRNFVKEELRKLGSQARGTLYIQLEYFPEHYLVVVVTNDKYKYALIETKIIPNSMYTSMVMDDVGWLDYSRIMGEQEELGKDDPRAGMKRKRSVDVSAMEGKGYTLETSVLRELYSYCCARVAYVNVEKQFKIRHIPFTHSSLARSVPSLCVQSQHILAGAPAAEAAMPNIRVIPLNWWSQDPNKRAQVVTCVKLKYVYIRGGGTGGIIRPSKRIIYDTTEAVVSFLSENVNTCVDEFLEEWARVSKMVVIARAVAQMDGGIRLLEFDLREVVFAYEGDFTVAVRCVEQGGSTFELKFGRIGGRWDEGNPHSKAEPFLRTVLNAERLALSVQRLVMLLRNTLPIVVALEEEGADVFAKSAGWYRVLYQKRSRTHALDFRLMTERRVAILDGSYSLFSTKDLGKDVSTVGLKPIPNFSSILRDLPGPGRRLDVSMVCKVEEIGPLAKELHQQVAKELASEMEL